MEMLQSQVIEKKLNFSCYDVFGDPKDTSQVQDLSACATRIISAVQQGKLVIIVYLAVILLLLLYVYR